MRGVRRSFQVTQMQPPDPSPQPSAATPPPIQLLVVEDDGNLSEVYQQVLSRFGSVHGCGSLEQALQAVRATAPDVILLDLGLPDSQGLEGLVQLRKQAPGAAVVITTGASDEALAIQALRGGAQDFLLKGRLEAATLAQSVRYALARKLGESKLRRTEALYSALTNNMLDLLSILEEPGAWLYTSPSYQRLLGYSEVELADLTLADLVHPDDGPRLQGALQQVFMDGSSWGLEYRLRHKNGSYLFFEAYAVRIRVTRDELPQAILVARDVTARKRTETERAHMEGQLRQAQKLEALGQLAAGIAHEINTPTQYIGDNANFLLDAFTTLGQLVTCQQALLARHATAGCTPEEVVAVRQVCQDADLDFLLAEIPKAITETLEGVQRVTRIVRAMQEFSHPGSASKLRADLNRAIESTVTLCRNEWKYVADLELDLAPELPFVPCLPGDLNQAILNLVINAAHAIEDQGGPAKGLIRIRTRLAGDWVEVQVQDTGCGIPAALQARVFDPFFTTKPAGKGTGQGLAIVHSIVVDKHKGAIAVESEVGKGTTFILRFPLQEA